MPIHSAPRDSDDAILALREVAWRLEPASWLPMRAARTATRFTRRYGRTVRSVPLATQWRDQCLFRVRYRLSSDSYYRYRLYEPERRRRAPAFLELSEMVTLRRWLYARLAVDTDQLADKRRFHARATAHGLPTPPVVASFEGGRLQSFEGTLPETDLFSKEARALCGRGAVYWIWRQGAYLSSSGRHVPQRELLDTLARESLAAPMLLQPRMANHPDVARFSAAGLCTVRAITSCAPDGAPRLLRACFRMPIAAHAADNFAQGGLASPVDPASGIVGPAVRKGLEVAAGTLDRHPTTGAVITGTRLPGWRAIHELALRAHKVFREFPSVGWDIALTPDGPVVIEGNFNWDVVLAQQPCGTPLAGTGFAEDFWEFVRRTRNGAHASML